MRLDNALQEEFASRANMTQHFPMLTDHGIRDTDVTIHSHFLSYLAFLGQVFGYSGIVECPLPETNGKSLTKLGEVRPDVLWFDKRANVPVAAFEFERFESKGEAKLREKIENLVIAYLRSQRQLKTAILIYWTRTGLSPKMIREAVPLYQIGFVRNGIRVSGINCPLHIFKCTWRPVVNGLVVSDILPVQIV